MSTITIFLPDNLNIDEQELEEKVAKMCPDASEILTEKSSGKLLVGTDGSYNYSLTKDVRRIVENLHKKLRKLQQA